MKVKILFIAYYLQKRIFYLLLFIISSFLYNVTGGINSGINSLLSNFSLVINNIYIPKLEVLIAPVVEESIKLIGYSILFFFSIKFVSKLGYKSKKEFLNENLAIAFLIMVGSFGFYEGLSHNFGFNKLCLIAFIFLNTLIHVTYSIYPFILGRKHNNWFVVFLPIAIMLHAVHNFILTVFWDNKWVTFTMTFIFLIPIFILKRKDLCNIAFSMSSKLTKNVLIIIFLISYFYVLLCCLLAFR